MRGAELLNPVLLGTGRQEWTEAGIHARRN